MTLVECWVLKLRQTVGLVNFGSHVLYFSSELCVFIICTQARVRAQAVTGTNLSLYSSNLLVESPVVWNYHFDQQGL